MKLVQVHRAIEDWINRPVSLRGEDDEAVMAEQARREIVGAVGRTRYWIQLELNDQTAARLLRQCDDALGDQGVPEGKRGAIEQARKAVLEQFPRLA